MHSLILNAILSFFYCNNAIAFGYYLNYLYFICKSSDKSYSLCEKNEFIQS